ncbi:MAG: hypothetical protein AB1564_14050 [Chloroflexota bacterium]
MRIRKSHLLFSASIFLVIVLACSLPGASATPPPAATEIIYVTATPEAGAPPTDAPPPTETATLAPVVTHVIFPASSSPTGSVVYDVNSSGTGPEGRAPYGDSYDINRLERPFLQDMTYVPDLDIDTFYLSEDTNWYYISVNLVGSNPNNALEIKYGVEFDTDADGFGDIIIWAYPPYKSEWTNDNVLVYADENHDTSGLSADKSDAPISTNGYETVMFYGGVGEGDDPDLAWVRMNTTGPDLQFAFKKSLTGSSFMYGVLADAGLKDVSKLDYVDRFTEEEAGSPVRDKKHYPLKALFAVDNTCRAAFGFNPTGYEPMLCPPNEPPPGETGCEDPAQYTNQASCEAAGCAWRINGSIVIAVVYYCTYP